MIDTVYYVMFGAYRQTFVANNIHSEDEARLLAQSMAKRFGVASYGNNKGFHKQVMSEDVALSSED